jgi:N-acetylglucosaminyldiphosphoundecaprenol N-acetyl-beta-D-mannosaminyltransferase
MSSVPVIDPQSTPTAFRVLGARVSAVQIPEVIQQIREWIEERRSGRYVTVTGMHGIMEAHRDFRFKNILECADLVVPDGMPLVWLARVHKHPLKRRVYGPELMETFCRATGGQYRHFLYGGASDVPGQLKEKLYRTYGTRVVGTYSPPFRPLTPSEERVVATLVRMAAPDVLWVGLSTPKQERWMAEHREVLNVPVMIGVGAAFDFLIGRVAQAPPWMREHGLEWLFRLASEPRRLWRRYLILGSAFVWNVALELIGIRTGDRPQVTGNRSQVTGNREQ